MLLLPSRLREGPGLGAGNAAPGRAHCQTFPQAEGASLVR